jgi:ABC-type multidrug transport system fused ATPase/permease subunit
MEKDYKNLHRGLVLKYFWQVMRNFKVSFFIVIFGTIISASLDIYIPLQFLKLWDVLNTNDFSLVASAQNIIIFIFILGFARWSIKRFSSFFYAYFQANVMAGLRKQAFSYMLGIHIIFLMIIWWIFDSKN